MATLDDLGLGRIYIPDERDRGYPAETMIPAVSERTWRYWWPGGLHIFQGRTPHCTDYAAHHAMADGPQTHARPDGARTGPLWKPGEMYFPAQKIDQWPGENYDGTSNRAVAAVLRSRGYIVEYRHLWSVDAIIRFVLEKGVVIMGTWWWSGFYDPGDVKKISGRRLGGHAWVINGANTARGVVRCKNSHRILPDLWLPIEGNEGLERLVREDGDATVLVEAEQMEVPEAA